MAILLTAELQMRTTLQWLSVGGVDKSESSPDIPGALSAVTGGLAGAFAALTGSNKDKLASKDASRAAEKSGGFKFPSFSSPKRLENKKDTGMHPCCHTSLCCCCRQDCMTSTLKAHAI